MSKAVDRAAWVTASAAVHTTSGLESSSARPTAGKTAAAVYSNAVRCGTPRNVFSGRCNAAPAVFNSRSHAVHCRAAQRRFPGLKQVGQGRERHEDVGFQLSEDARGRRSESWIAAARQSDQVRRERPHHARRVALLPQLRRRLRYQVHDHTRRHRVAALQHLSDLGQEALGEQIAIQGLHLLVGPDRPRQVPFPQNQSPPQLAQPAQIVQTLFQLGIAPGGIRPRGA